MDSAASMMLPPVGRLVWPASPTPALNDLRGSPKELRNIGMT